MNLLPANSFLKNAWFCNPRQELPLVALARVQNQRIFCKRLAACIRAGYLFNIQHSLIDIQHSKMNNE
jgi:hypothetical protein